MNIASGGADDVVHRSDLLDLDLMAQGLERYGRRNRLFIRILGLSVAFDIALTAGLGFALQRADMANNATRIACRASNEAKATELQLWEYILSLPSTSPRSAAQQAEIATFRQHLVTTFAPRRCP